MKFESLLIANRGEIARRINRTAKDLGLLTVAVYSDADRGSPHVAEADQSVRIGATPVRESYLNVDAILAAAASTGAQAIHPGYGLLSEDASFARRVIDAGLTWVGPTPEQLEMFGSKDRARALARTADVPLASGSELLDDADAAVAEAERVGYPVMLKATGGGGGIGMARCHDESELREGFARVIRQAAANFGSAGVFLERLIDGARHIEVQVFGDGQGLVLTLGDRDCSLQRRHQKVLEEAPAPGISNETRSRLIVAAHDLCASAQYRSAGTVEFIYDPRSGEFYFLEVNARLQVEHTVTEEVFGIDLVEWMLRLAGGDDSMFVAPAPEQSGHAIQARIYAEDPGAGHRPSAGTLTQVSFPAHVRVDTFVKTGTEVSNAYDPLLAKVIARGDDRQAAIGALALALEQTRIAGLATNLGLLRAALEHPPLVTATHTTASLDSIADCEPRIEVLKGGTMTTVQDWPGRLGLWHVGVPPSGPMDDRSFRAGNLLLGNGQGAPGLECMLEGPTLRFSHQTTVCLTGAPSESMLDGEPVALWEPVTVPVGATLEVGAIPGPGLRTYVLFHGGIDVPTYLDSCSTFTLGHFGGHGGRALRPGDVLETATDVSSESTAGLGTVAVSGPQPQQLDASELSSQWEIDVLAGPHGDGEFFTAADIETFYTTDWEVHFNSARTGVRLIGPRPQWARTDGGDGGLHPSNIHDTPYAVGTVDYTGDTPILLGPDGPSLGGFVCPATVTRDDRWKLGQVRPGDRLRFRARAGREDGGVLERTDERSDAPAVTYRRAGDENLLIEYGPMTLDLGLRMRVHLLAAALTEANIDGIVDLTPGVRSLQVRVDPDRCSIAQLLGAAREIEKSLARSDEMVVPSRHVRMPLSWDDPGTRLAIERYMAGVRDDAPWCPWNIEFIRRVNGLDSIDDVYRIVFDASYLVLGLGDVYLGAPLTTPIDPRHRLVTTKYNPARTWTPENAVGIGGAYLGIYGLEGPGGYQLIGRTIQLWRRHGEMQGGRPWLLRFFDRISWYPVAADELLEMRAEMEAGRLQLDISEGSFSLAEHEAFLKREATSIAEFRSCQSAAFAAERQAWEEAGEFLPRDEDLGAVVGADDPAATLKALELPADAIVLEAPVSASVWQVDVEVGQRVAAGQKLVTLEAMKMETELEAPVDGAVLHVLVSRGDQVAPGASLVVIGK